MDTQTYIIEANDYKDALIFLDIDGVLNHQLFYKKQMETKKELIKKAKKGDIDRLQYDKSNICPDSIKMFSNLCEDIQADVVVSSTWRLNRTIPQLQAIFDYCGGTFRVIGKTPHTGYERGVDIDEWLSKNIKIDTFGIGSYKFKRYVILDDDSDMLLKQREHFFQIDSYCGITPNVCYRVKRFFERTVNYKK